MFGKTYNTVGSTDSNFIIKTKGDLKVQWGGKFIDIIKNGKVASSQVDILKTISSSEKISSNGIYLVPTSEGNEVWVSIDGTKVNLSGEIGTTYVSFLSPQTEVTSDQKYTALTNAGLYYETLEEAEQAGIKAGIIFVVGENKLYLAKDGKLQEYLITQKDTSANFEKINIGDLKIYNEGSDMIISSPSLLFNINDQLALELNSQLKSYLNIAMASGTYIQSANASSSNGYRLYMDNGKSVLEIDSLVWREMDQVLNRFQDSKLDEAVIYSLHGNIILSTKSDNSILCELKYKNTFTSGDTVYILVPLDPQVQVTQEQDENGNINIIAKTVGNSQDTIVKVYYIADGVESEIQMTILAGENTATYSISGVSEFQIQSFSVISDDEETIASKGQLIEGSIQEVEGQFISISVDSSIRDLFILNSPGSFICASNVPLIKIQDNNIDVLDNSKLHTRIGVVVEDEIEPLKECPEAQQEVKVGIYSDNFIGLNPKLYDAVFKRRCDYPKYDSPIQIPEDFKEDKYNSVIPNIEWIKELLKLVVPSGTITMFNGQSEIPDGWAVCDGTNGTPNLVGKFIKAVSSINEVGENESQLNENNEFTLTSQHLPKHSHPHTEHTHSISGTIDTEKSGNLTLSLNSSNYNYGIESVQKTFITSVSGEGINSESGTVNGISGVSTQGGTATGGDHYHSLNVDGKLSISPSTSIEESLSDSEWQNKPIKIEPRSYSLVFIMKL